MKNILLVVVLFFLGSQFVCADNIPYRYILDCNIEEEAPLEICKEVEIAVVKAGLLFGESRSKERQGLIRFYQHLVPGPKGDIFLLVVFTFHTQGRSLLFQNHGPDKIDSIWYGARSIGDMGAHRSLEILLKKFSENISKQLIGTRTV